MTVDSLGYSAHPVHTGVGWYLKGIGSRVSEVTVLEKSFLLRCGTRGHASGVVIPRVCSVASVFIQHSESRMWVLSLITGGRYGGPRVAGRTAAEGAAGALLPPLGPILLRKEARRTPRERMCSPLPDAQPRGRCHGGSGDAALGFGASVIVIEARQTAPRSCGGRVSGGVVRPSERYFLARTADDSGVRGACE